MRLLVILFALYTSSAFAYQSAKIIVKEAVVYADLKLTSAIGKIEFGKIIYVGEKRRRHGTIVTTVLAGKIVYLRARDLILEKDFAGLENKKIKETEHDVDLLLVEETDKLNVNNYVLFTGSTLGLGANWQSLSNQFGETAEGVFGFKMIFEHRPEVHNWSWGAGLDFYSNNQTNVSISIIALELNLYYSLLSIFKVLTLDLVNGIVLSGSTNITTLDGTEYSSTLYGFHTGAQVKLFPFSQIGFTAGAKYVGLAFSGLDQIIINEDTSATLGTLNGIEIFGGVSYKF